MEKVQRLKLVIGVDISRRDEKRSGREVWVCNNTRRMNADERTMLRRFEALSLMLLIVERYGCQTALNCNITTLVAKE